MNHTAKSFSIFLSIILYGLSLYCSAAIIPDFETGGPQTYPGLLILISGWISLLSFQVAWLANPIYFWALMTYGSKKSYYLGVSAIILALFSPFLFVDKLLFGFYLWIASFIVLTYGNRLHHKSQTFANNPG